MDVCKVALQARALQNNFVGFTETQQDCQHDRLTHGVKDAPSQHETVQHAAEAVWSTLVHKVIQREARSKRFDEVWPQIVHSLILKGFSGVY